MISFYLFKMIIYYLATLFYIEPSINLNPLIENTPSPPSIPPSAPLTPLTPAESNPIPILSSKPESEPVLKDSGMNFFSILRNPVPYSLWEMGKRVFRGELGSGLLNQPPQIIHFDVNSSENNLVQTE